MYCKILPSKSKNVITFSCNINDYYTSDSLWKIWLVESIQSIHNSLWTWHDKCNIWSEEWSYLYCGYTRSEESEKLLRWSLFFSYITAVQIWTISYILHITSLQGKIWTQQIDLAPNVWLHSSVGRASHWYSWRSWVWIPLKPWFFQTSSF